MHLISLQSGSHGNSVYVESGDVRLLFDAGVSGSQAKERLALHGRTPESVNAVFITHDHSDHVKCAGVFARKFKLPIYMTPRTYQVSRRRAGLDKGAEICHFRAGSATRIGHVTVHAIGTPHDAVDGVVFVVDDGVHKLGICTDLGHVFGDMRAIVGAVDGLFIEANYDEKLLADGPYPPSLKRRIAGPGGHISNRDAAELLAESAGGRLQWVCLAHLSAENNTPELALRMHREALGTRLSIHLAPRYHASAMLTLGPTAAPSLPFASGPVATPKQRTLHELFAAAGSFE